ncbi:molybdopterin-dependent oxidoreductase [Actinopolymorpha alba]|uniref:molybdopterin-dependent oxidoreductase n=1 Tax=Actinopolymorpha alba TaxID=533267 RepID=UPI0003A96085|nr:molybdopterin-dependent oxidoreductase [Actinopolymorpha alba]
MPTSISRSRAALAGVLATGAGLAAAELVAGVVGGAQSPVVTVGAAFIDVIPSGLREFGITLLGTADKPVLITGILVVLAAFGALVGMVAARVRGVGVALLGVLALVGVVAAVTRPGAGPGAAIPSVVAWLVAVCVLLWLLRMYAVGAGREAEAERRVTRRNLLWTGGLVVVGSLLAVGVGRAFAGRRLAAEQARSALRIPEPPTTAPPARANLPIPGITPWQTPNDVFYRIDTALSVPMIDPAEWRLRVHGMVDRPLELTFGDLLRRRIVYRWVTLTCVSNVVGGDLAGNALWTGVPIADILAEAGVHRDADAVQSTSDDGWTCGTPLSALTDGRPSLLAFGMNGAPLPFEHGFPVRMVVPGLYGYVSATKWVVDIEVTRFDRFTAYWTTRGWAEKAPVKTASRIDVPLTGATVRTGRVAVAGVAWAQHRGITRVEVRVDRGPWQVARLGGEPTKDSWRQWVWTWDATPGAHELQVRATDGTGVTQTGRLADPVPNGATGWHTIDVQVS